MVSFHERPDVRVLQLGAYLWQQVLTTTQTAVADKLLCVLATCSVTLKLTSKAVSAAEVALSQQISRSDSTTARRVSLSNAGKTASIKACADPAAADSSTEVLRAQHVLQIKSTGLDGLQQEIFAAVGTIITTESRYCSCPNMPPGGLGSVCCRQPTPCTEPTYHMVIEGSRSRAQQVDPHQNNQTTCAENTCAHVLTAAKPTSSLQWSCRRYSWQ
jgi:hypothetical protein